MQLAFATVLPEAVSYFFLKGMKSSQRLSQSSDCRNKIKGCSARCTTLIHWRSYKTLNCTSQIASTAAERYKGSVRTLEIKDCCILDKDCASPIPPLVNRIFSIKFDTKSLRLWKSEDVS